MGTHNAIMKFDDHTYFEIIAVNPDGIAPSRPRWFSMDNARDRLAIEQQPSLITWVVNTDNLERCVEGATYPYPLGFPIPVGHADCF